MDLSREGLFLPLGSARSMCASVAACEDYRASASIDLAHDRASQQAGERIGCEVLVLWGTRGVVHRLFDVEALWRAQCAGVVRAQPMEAGHFIPEELPVPTAELLKSFFQH